MTDDGAVGKVQTIPAVFIASRPEHFTDKLVSALPVSVAPAPAVPPAPGLSSAARLLGAVFSQFPDVPRVLLNQGAPVLATAPIESASSQLAMQRLQDAVQSSGLFYESHLAAWVSGNPAALERLQRAPHMRPHSLTSAVRPEDSPSPLPPDSQAIGEGMAHAQESVDAPPALQGREEVWGIVRQQLDIATSGQLAVRLQLWPEQWVDLEIQREPDEEGAQEMLSQSRWTASVEAQIAPFGHVQAKLRLVDTELKIRMGVPDTARPVLYARMRELEDALSQAGLRVQLSFDELAHGSSA